MWPSERKCWWLSLHKSPHRQVGLVSVGYTVQLRKIITLFNVSRVTNAEKSGTKQKEMIIHATPSCNHKCAHMANADCSGALSWFLKGELKAEKADGQYFTGELKQTGSACSTLPARSSSTEQAIMQWLNRSLVRRVVRLLLCSHHASEQHMAILPPSTVWKSSQLYWWWTRWSIFVIIGEFLLKMLTSTLVTTLSRTCSGIKRQWLVLTKVNHKVAEPHHKVSNICSW